MTSRKLDGSSALMYESVNHCQGENSRSAESAPTNGVLDAQTVKLSLGKTAPNLRLVDFVRVVHTAIERDNMLDKDGLGEQTLRVKKCVIAVFCASRPTPRPHTPAAAVAGPSGPRRPIARRG